MKAARGFSLPTAIFLLVILSLLGAFMLSMSTTQSITSAQDLQGARAYRAARGGIEWALFNLNGAPACPSALTTLAIDGFSVALTCSPSVHDEAGTNRYVFFVTSTASAGGVVGSLGHVERMVSTVIEF